MKAYAYSEVGVGKTECEDAILFSEAVISGAYYEKEISLPGIFAIADGVGSNAGGAMASRFVLNELRKMTYTRSNPDELMTKVSKINEKLLQYAGQTQGKEKMATTLSVFFLSEEDNAIVHIGNTRIYALQGNYIKQITEDQTTYQWLINRGQFQSIEACNKSEIMYCMGGGAKSLFQGAVVVESRIMNLCKRILLTTDGIHDYVTIEELEDLLLNSVDEKALKNIVARARENGSEDDKSIVVIDRM